MHHIRHAAVALVLVTSAGGAAAQTTIVTQPVQTQTVVTQQPLTLSPVQRQTVYRTITRERVVQPSVTVAQAPPPVVEYRIGTRVPNTVSLYPFPQQLAVEVPAIQNYRYMVINDRAWLVDPVTSEIVAELDE